MANTEPPNLLLLFFTIICAAYVIQGVAGSRRELVVPHDQTVHYFSQSEAEFLFREDGRNREMKRDPRRSMIGSTAPTCTYNECRGCKYKCRAEQVPVEGNDPINSAYHYRCVCHR